MYQFNTTSFSGVFAEKQNTPRNESDNRVHYPARMADRTGKPSFRWYHPYLNTEAPMNSTYLGEAFVQNLNNELPSGKTHGLNVCWPYESNTLPPNVRTLHGHALNQVTVCSESFTYSTLQNLQSVCNLASTNCVSSSTGSMSLPTATVFKSQKREMEHEHPFHWRRRTAPVKGMTRTRDKYRVVYTEKQWKGLERAYEENKFISLQTKLELAKELDLFERQIKLWFQNRRAKERRDLKKFHMTKTPEGSSSPKVNITSNTSLDDVSPKFKYADCKLQAEEADNNFPAEKLCSRTINKNNQEGQIMATDSSSLCMFQSTMFANPWQFGESREWSPYLDVSPIGSSIGRRW